MTITIQQSEAGAEPGVDPTRESALFKQDCVIDLIDYDSDSVSFQRLTNTEFIKLFKNGAVEHLNMTRWINIGGIDWDVLRTLALKYHIHSLALEDILHERGDVQSKADYYPDHLFIRILCHSICSDHELHNQNSSSSDPEFRHRMPPAYTSKFDSRIPQSDLERNDIPESIHISTSRTPLTGDSDIRKNRLNASLLHSLQLRSRLSGLSGWRKSRDEEQIIRIHTLTAKDRVNVKHESLYIFLSHDGTVISITPTPSLEFTEPIADRLNRTQSVLRTSEDASLLVQGLLDLVVDRILEVVDEYQVKLHKLEHDILVYPSMDNVRSLHLLSGDLTMHKLTLEPIKTMLYNLRRYDVDRCIAMANHFKAEAESSDQYNSSSNSNSDSDVANTRNEYSIIQSKRHLVSSVVDSDSERPADLDIDISNTKRNRNRNRNHNRSRRRASKSNAINDDEDDNDNDNERKDKKSKTQLKKEKSKLAEAETKRNKRKEAEREERLRWEKGQLYHSHSLGKSARGESYGGSENGKVKGYLSYTCKVYLADVYDHMNFALTSIDMFSGTSENLINYAFNKASYDMNVVMNRLTLVTIIFLPMTLLTGYFGMNFQPFKSLDGNSEFLFWKIAIPVIAVLIPIFMFQDFKNFARYVSWKWKSGRAVKGMNRM